MFRLALRQTEGLIGSVIGLLGLDLAVPDHSTLSRRAETLEVPRPRSSPGAEPMHLPLHSTGLKLLGAGEWLHEKLNNRLEQDHRGLKGRYRPMLGFKCPRSAARFCRGHDELRNDLRPRTRRNQHVPALSRRMLFLRRTVTVLDIWKLHNGALPRLWGHRLYLLARVLTEPALQPSHQILASGTTRITTPEPDKSHPTLNHAELGKGGIVLSHRLEVGQARARHWQLSDFSEDAAAIAAAQGPCNAAWRRRIDIQRRRFSVCWTFPP